MSGLSHYDNDDGGGEVVQRHFLFLASDRLAVSLSIVLDAMLN